VDQAAMLEPIDGFLIAIAHGARST
jgi:hypothetical protein